MKEIKKLRKQKDRIEKVQTSMHPGAFQCMYQYYQQMKKCQIFGLQRRKKGEQDKRERERERQ